ncbi:MAG: iron-containing alcohol dehydrogenase, partial [Planctomycetaceae bacterium]|nr:iron-containing alcohol dehydrogenase [Planctomycetaceae bacterium]
KMACGDKKAAAKVAILDPELTVTMPTFVTAVTGIDAISHAVESHVTTRRNAVSQLFSRQAWQLLAPAFPNVLKDSQNLSARGAMLVGAHLAGSAIENSMLGATHSLANPLSATYEMVHGVAIGLLLPHVIRFNGQVPEIAVLYGLLAEDANLCEARDPEAVGRLADLVTSFVVDASLPTCLREAGVQEADLPMLAQGASEQWTAQFNPRPVNSSTLLELYQCAFHPRDFHPHAASS